MEKETMLSEKIATSSTTIEQQSQTIQRLQEDLNGIRLGKEDYLCMNLAYAGYRNKGDERVRCKRARKTKCCQV